ncbi:MAG: GNAT family N-acetyltransferase [Candidatus Acidiferrales bacterium]
MAIPYKIRRAELRDVEELVHMRVELLHVAAALGAPTDLTDSEWKAVAEAVGSYFKDALPAGKYCGVVAEAEGKIVACGGIIFMERPPYQGNLAGREAYLMNMYTLPEWRGKGAGGAIVTALLKHAREAGAGRVSLDAEQKARHVYEKAGFHGNVEAMEMLF